MIAYTLEVNSTGQKLVSQPGTCIPCAIHIDAHPASTEMIATLTSFFAAVTIVKIQLPRPGLEEARGWGCAFDARACPAHELSRLLARESRRVGHAESSLPNVTSKHEKRVPLGRKPFSRIFSAGSTSAES